MMAKYLFFDTEASNWFDYPKLCEFGYILVDENFNLLRMDVIPMSPGEGRQNRFDDSVRQRDPSFKRGFEQEYYFESPEFPHYYEKIKNLLEDPETIVFGFAVDNDVKVIRHACKRYNLESIKYEAYDIQRLFHLVYPGGDKPDSLNKIYAYLLDKGEFHNVDSHLSRDDAIMTLVVFYKLAQKINAPVIDILTNLYPSCKFVPLTEKEKHQRASLKACNKLWGETFRLYPDAENDNSYIGKRVTIWSSIKFNYKATKCVCDKINKSDYVAVDSITNSDYIICLDDNDIENVKSSLKRPYEGTYIALKDFLSL